MGKQQLMDSAADLLAQIDEEIENLQAMRTQLAGLVDDDAPQAKRVERAEPVKRGRPARAAKKSKQSPDVNWPKVLEKLDKTFSRDDFDRATPMLRDFPQARSMALARFVRQGEILKAGDREYRKAA